MRKFLLQSAAAAALLLTAGCSGSPTANVQANTDLGTDNALALNEAAPADNVAEAAPSVAPPPAAPAGAAAEEAAPLTQAAQVAQEIDSAPDVERVPFQGGWAWRRHGQIIRTASRDGSRISYFRLGESTPFFVQQGGQGFSYVGGRPRRSYDRNGHAAPLAPDRQSEAQRLADQSRHDRSAAEHAPAAPQRGNGGPDRSGAHADRGDHPGPDQAEANAAAAETGHGRADRSDRGHDRRRNDDQANRMGR